MAATPDGPVRRQRCRRHGLPALGCSQPLACFHELRGHAELTPSHFPSMLFALAISRDARLLATGDKVGHIVGLGPRIGPILDNARGTRALHLGPSPAPAFDRRHPLPGILARRQISWRPAAAARSRTSTTWMARPWSKSSTGKKASAPHTFASDKFKGLVERLEFHPSGDWLLAGGGGDKDGFFMFFDVAAKKSPLQEKTPMSLHDFAMGPASDTIYAAGHKKIAIYSTQS